MILEKIIDRIKKIKDKNKREDSLDAYVGVYFGIGGGIMGLIGLLAEDIITGLGVGLLAGLIFTLFILTAVQDNSILKFIKGYLIIMFTFLGLGSLISHYPAFLPLWLFFGIGFILVEIFFWLDNQKPSKKQSKFWFTALKKGEALLEAIAILGFVNLIRLGINKLRIFEHWDIILKWIGYIGAGLIGLAVVVGLISLYIKLNSLKYSNQTTTIHKGVRKK